VRGMGRSRVGPDRREKREGEGVATAAWGGGRGSGG
jgi:hypothetical protein